MAMPALRSSAIALESLHGRAAALVLTADALRGDPAVGRGHERGGPFGGLAEVAADALNSYLMALRERLSP